MILIEIDGRPIPWRAPYVGKRGAFSTHTVRKQEIQWQMKAIFNQKPLGGPIFLDVKFYFIPPKNTSYVRKKQMLNGQTKFVKRPDLSNLIKFIEDCGTGILWNDDNQIFRLVAQKLYGTKEKSLLTIREELWND